MWCYGWIYFKTAEWVELIALLDITFFYVWILGISLSLVSQGTKKRKMSISMAMSVYASLNK